VVAIGTIKAFLDMDPGIDDALALSVALNRLDVLGVTTVAGNVGVEHTFQNAHHVLRHTGRSIPVVAGAHGPLFYPLVTAKHIHGKAGLGDYTWDSPDVPVPKDHAWTWLWQQLQQASAPCHLVATGPLTNVALLLLAYPEATRHLAAITCMAGGMPGAKLDKAAEFNVFVDPHAADAVFRYGEQVQMVGINVTHRALLPLADLPRLQQYGRVGQMLFTLLSYYGQAARGEGGNPDAFPVDDVVAVAAVHAPELFEWKSMPLTVVLEGPLRGTVVLSPYATTRPEVHVAADIHVPDFLDWLWSSFDA
jgi:pyrimidine-specific ribonucleoside hydrolase